jgi:hypothetical protein
MLYPRVLCILSVIAASTVRSSVLFSDDFSYPDGALVEVAGGKWTTHSGTPGQARVAGAQLQLSQRNSEDVSVLLPGGTGITNAAVAYYARFSVLFTALPSGPNGTYFAHFKDGSPTTGLRCRIFATTNGAAVGSFRCGIAAAANAASGWLPDDLHLSTKYTLICRMDRASNASTLWLNPASEADPGAASTDEAAVKAAVAFAFRESLAGGAGIGELTVDDLIIATTFAEVVESPAGWRASISLEDPIVHLRWPASSDQSYSVWYAESGALEWGLLASDLWFWDGVGAFDEFRQESGLRFYRVSSP